MDHAILTQNNSPVESSAKSKIRFDLFYQITVMMPTQGSGLEDLGEIRVHDHEMWTRHNKQSCSMLHVLLNEVCSGLG